LSFIVAIAMRADGRYFEVSLSQAFLEYGLWQDYGTGRETPRKSSADRELAHTSAEAQPGSRLRHPRGNSGDIGKTNRGSSESIGELARAMPSRDRGRRSQRRQRRKWFSRKYYASVMNIKEFYEDNIGKSFTGIISNALNKNFGHSG
jgi:hypothetical protein